MADAPAVSKTSKKNKKRKGKKNQDSMKDISYEDVRKILKDELEMAKMEGDHVRANKLRDQVWIMNDLCHGKRTALPEEEYQKILESLPLASKSSSKPSAQKDRDAEDEEEAAGAENSSLSEPEKQLKKLKKKLDQIEKLKTKQESGATLEKNQLDKIQTEKSIRDEIADLEELIEATLELS